MHIRFSLFLLFLLFFFSLSAQTGIIGPGFTNGWSLNDIRYFQASMGNSRIATLQARNPSGNGLAFFRIVNRRDDGVNQYGPPNCMDTDLTTEEERGTNNMPICNNSSAFFINAPNQTDNYIFKTPSNNSSDFVFFRVQGPIRNILSRTQNPANDVNAQVSADSPVEVTATYDGALSPGQVPYLYYVAINLSDLNYFQTAVLPMIDTGDGTTFSVEIPAQPSQTFLSYTFLSSGDQVVPQANQNSVNYRAINFDDNNGAGGYNYMTVGALPVSFKEWNGKRMESGVTLNWETGSEQNASHFVIERSDDNGNNWKACTTVTAQNNINGAVYNTTDPNAPIGKLLYRLKQLDFDGRFVYSGILSIDGRANKDAISIYPQPAESSIRLQFDESSYSEAQMTLSDLHGRAILSQPLTENNQSIDITRLPKGVYLLQVHDGNQLRSSQKIVKQ